MMGPTFSKLVSGPCELRVIGVSVVDVRMLFDSLNHQQRNFKNEGMLTQCSYRHLLSDHQTWPIAAALLCRTYRTHPTRHPPLKLRDRLPDGRPKRRLIDVNAQSAFLDTLHDILKQHKSIDGLTSRKDSYISLRELLNYPHFRALSFPTLQKVLKEDRTHRFELLYQPLKGGCIDSWWLRVKSKEEKDVRLDSIVFGDNVGAAIHSTTWEDWTSYISQKGISRRNDDYIQITREIPVQDYFTSSAPSSKQVLIHLDIKLGINMGIRFFVSSRPSPFYSPFIPSWPVSTEIFNSPLPTTRSEGIQPPPKTKSPTATTYKYRSTKILTPGNEFGFLPPELFMKVEVVTVKRKILWASDDQVGEAVAQEPSDEEEDGAILTSDIGSTEDIAVDIRPDDVQIPEMRMDQFFIDLPIDHQARAHPDLKKEALAIFST